MRSTFYDVSMCIMGNMGITTYAGDMARARAPGAFDAILEENSIACAQRLGFECGVGHCNGSTGSKDDRETSHFVGWRGEFGSIRLSMMEVERCGDGGN